MDKKRIALISLLQIATANYDWQLNVGPGPAFDPVHGQRIYNHEVFVVATNAAETTFRKVPVPADFNLAPQVTDTATGTLSSLRANAKASLAALKGLTAAQLKWARTQMHARKAAMHAAIDADTLDTVGRANAHLYLDALLAEIAQ